MYRETVSSFNKSITGPQGELCFTISPIDADQIPDGYLKSVKVSVNPVVPAGYDKTFLVVASTDDTPASTSDLITGGIAVQGGGTVWLNLKRPIRSSAEEPNRNDGEVYIHIYTQNVLPSDSVEVNILAECWGRFLNMAAN